jgi:tetratricopeptide (TPR) repeat protein
MVLEELRAHAEPDAAVVSETARSFLGRRFDFAEPADSDARPARGRQLLGYQQHRFGVGGHPGPFVGRDQELGILRTRWRDAVQGRGQIVALVGEPGIGKSRLLFEFRRALGDEPLTYLEGRGESYGAGIPYLPVIELLKVHFGIGERDDPPATGDKVTGRFAPWGEAIAADASPFLVLLSAPGADPEWQELEPAQRRQRTLDALTRFVLSLSQAQPVMLAIEDLHWIDAETQAFLDRLVVSLPAARVLVLVSYRPEYGHTWGGKSSYTQLRLDPLATASAEELARSLVGADAALQPLTRLLVERTEGNPFFLEESIRTLIETRGLVAERGAYRPGPDVHALEVPPTVRAVLAARIDRLPPEDRQLLQAAAVIGKDVPFALLRAIADVPEPMLQRMLTSLQSAEFLHPTRILPEIEYTFKHALTHDVAYEALHPDRQRALHGRILDAIEKLCADRLTEQVERLAHHAVRGAIWDRAARYLRRAGEKAVARSANREAMALFEQALAALQQLPESPETLSEALNIRIALGPCNGWVHGQAAREYEASHLAARELCLRLDDRPRLFSALWGLWHVSFNRGLYRDARGLAEGLLSLARELGDPVLVLEAHHSLWSSLYGSGDLEAAELHTREGLAQYDSQRHRAYAAVYGGHDTGVCCLNFAALTAWARGYPDRALRYTQNALQLAGQLSHAQSMALALYYAAVVHYHRREHQATVEKAGAALDTAVVHGHRFSADRSAFLARLGLEGTLEESDLTQLHQTARPPWWRWDHTFGFCLLAEAYARAGLPDKGLEVLAEIPEHALETPFGPDVYRCRGELLLGRGDTDPSGAETCFRSAIELARRGGHRSLELRATTSLSRLLAQRGRRDEGRQALGKVYGWFTEGFDTGDLRVARTLLDSLERPGAGA